jgi:hypothetical protein
MAMVASLSGPAFGCVSAPVYSHGGPVRDHVSFVDNLRARGLRAEPRDNMRFALLSIPGVVLAVSGSELREPTDVISFAYDDTDLGRDASRVALEDAGRIAQDGLSARLPSGTVTTSYPGTPHLFRKERVIVLYVGDDPAMLSILRDLLGPQFAGQ